MAIIARPLRLPDTVALVIAGLVVGVGASVAGYPPIEVSPELVLIVLLPGLVFEAAYRLHFVELRRWFGGLALLAVPGVVISAAVVAVVLTVATGLRPDLAFIVGAMVSATDPAAVVATFKRLTVPAWRCPRWSTARASSTTAPVWSCSRSRSGRSTRRSTPLDAVVAFAGTIAISVADRRW